MITSLAWTESLSITPYPQTKTIIYGSRVVDIQISLDSSDLNSLGIGAGFTSVVLGGAVPILSLIRSDDSNSVLNSVALIRLLSQV